MPLRDHFSPPLADQRSWEELHGAWPGTIAFRLNAILPPDYYCGPRVHLGSAIEIDDAYEYHSRVYDMKYNRRLVAAVEIVCPGNKDRPESREAFVSKCHTLLQQDVCVVIVDPVTEGHANMYAELAERMVAAPPSIADSPIYAVSCRGIKSNGRWRFEAWEHALSIGSPLPTIPLWLTDRLCVPLELEATYEDTCRGLRIA